MKNYNDFCNSMNCGYYIVWNCGCGGDLTSCQLQGESENIEQLAPECPFKNELKEYQEKQGK